MFWRRTGLSNCRPVADQNVGNGAATSRRGTTCVPILDTKLAPNRLQPTGYNERQRFRRPQVAGSTPAAPATDIAVLEGGRGLSSGFWFGAHPWRLKPLLLGQHIREGLGRNRLTKQESLD